MVKPEVYLAAGSRGLWSLTKLFDGPLFGEEVSNG
jgi:hypothetical protein